MADHFPLGSNGDGNPPLTPDRYEQCYSALLTLIHQETPKPPRVTKEMGPPLSWQDPLPETLADLERWRTYAVDGNVMLLANAAPWQELSKLHARLSALSDYLGGEIDRLGEWHGTAGGNFKAYLVTLHGKVDGYAKTSPGNNQIGCYIEQVGALLEAAFSAQAAFKKDLYEIAKVAHQHLKAIDSGAAAVTEVGLLIMGVVGLGLSVAGGQIAGLNWVDKVFSAAAGSLVSKTGELAFSTAQSKLPLDGEHPLDIMKAATAALTTAVGDYRNACGQVIKAMGALWAELNNDYATVRDLRPDDVPKVDTSANPTFAPSAYGLQP